MPKILALIAHDSKKEDLVQLIKAHKNELAEFTLVATRDTGRLLQARTGLNVSLLQTGPLGGDLEIGALIANEEINGLIFYRDPLKSQPHEADIQPLLRICDIHNVPLATNLASAEAVIHLMAEHPEALSGHHVATEFLVSIAKEHRLSLASFRPLT